MKKLIIFGGLGLVLLLGGGVGALFALDMLPLDLASKKPERSEKIEVARPTARDAVYMEMKPLSAPVFEKNKILFNVMLTLSLELPSVTDKDDVAAMMPRIRDAMLGELYQSGLLRNERTGRYDLQRLKRRMLKVARNAVPDKELITNVLVIDAVRIN